MKKPVHVVEGLNTLHDTCEVEFSPDGRYMCTGVDSGGRGGGDDGHGALVVVDVSTGEVVR